MELSEVFSRNLRVRMATLGFKTSDLYKMTGISVSYTHLTLPTTSRV